MARIIAALLCHGEYQQLADVPNTLQPFPLTRTGLGQAADAAEKLRQYAEKQQLRIHPELDCSSNLNTWQTAQAIAEPLTASYGEPFSIFAYNCLSDRSLGTATNLSKGQIEAAIYADPRVPAPPENWFEDSNYRPPFPGAESAMEAGDRCATHINQRLELLRQDCNIDTLKVFVGHPSALSHALFLLGAIPFGAVSRTSQQYSRIIFLENDGKGSWKESNRKSPTSSSAAIS